MLPWKDWCERWVKSCKKCRWKLFVALNQTKFISDLTATENPTLPDGVLQEHTDYTTPKTLMDSTVMTQTAFMKGKSYPQNMFLNSISFRGNLS